MESTVNLFPLTLAQQDIYFEQLLYPGEAIYNIGAKIRIDGAVDIAVFKAAYRHLIDQHDAYRILVNEGAGNPGFTIMPEHDTSLEYLEYSDYHDAETAAMAFMDDAFKKPFVFANNQLLHKFILIKISATRFYLFSVYHHIITDGWGTSLMFQRLVKNYNELLEFGELKSVYPYRYQDYVEDDRAYQSSPAYSEDLAYWTAKFSTLPDALFTTVSGRQNKSRRKELMIPRELYNQLNVLAASLNASSFHVILGVLYVYLGRFHQSNDLSIGVPVLNRGKAVHKKTVGLFMGVNPLRVVVDFEDAFASLVATIKTTLKQDYRHQRFPLGKLVQALHLFGEKDRLFNVTLSYEKQNYADHFANTRTTVLPMTHESERVGLAVYIREFDTHEDVRIDFDYNLCFLDEAYINRLMQGFTQLLQQVIADPQYPVKQLKFVSDEDEHSILNGFNDTKAVYPSGDTVVDVFEQQVRLHGDKIAVYDGVSALSYKELNEAADRLAAYICKKASEGERTPVAVLLDRSAGMLTAFLGILKSGRPYIPLDPHFPEERLRYIITHSGCGCVVSDRELFGRFNFEQATPVFWEDTGTVAATENGYCRPSFSDTAYIIYTSGSTGHPKGVAIGHQALINFLYSMKHKPGISPDDVLYAVTTCSFDISILELFLPLITGATVYVAGAEVLADPVQVVADIQRVRPSIIQATPGFYQMLFDAGWEGMPSLKVLCGGDVLSTALAAKLMASFAAVWNMYGPTETTIWSSVKRLTRPEDATSIGSPINNTSFFMLDKWLNLCPIGAIGDLYIGGDGLANGYYLNEALTAEKFINSRFGRIYCTGDKGKWTEAGEVEFYGRNDYQVKIRGYRVETGEIEKLLLEYAGVAEAVVMARTVDGIAVLVAYIKPAGKVDEEDLMAFLGRKLPDYMVPAAYVVVPQFPKTPNNKIDRKALAALHTGFASKTDGTAQLPDDEVEEKLLEIWKQTLKVDHLGVTDNFFKMGGHSLSVVRVLAEVNKLFSCALAQKEMFLHPTIRSIAKRIRDSRGMVTGGGIPRAEEKAAYPLTRAQTNIWLLCQQKESALIYNMNAVYRVSGNLSTGFLELAVRSLIAMHEVLRTNFIELDGQPVQVIKDANLCEFSVQRITNAVAGREPELFGDFLYREFDLAKDLLIRIGLIEGENRPAYLMFSVHHIIMDGGGIEIFINDLMRLYNSMVQGIALQLSLPAYQFKDYSEWVNNGVAAAESAYWETYLKGYRAKDLFEKDVDTGGPSFRGDELSFSFGSTGRTALEEVSGNLNTTLFALLNALVVSFISRYSGHTDICIGTISSDRKRSEFLSCPGMFVSTVPLRVMAGDGDSFTDILTGVHQRLIEITQDGRPHQLPAIRQEQFFNILVAYQNPDFSLNTITGFDGVQLEPCKYPHKVSRFPVTLNFYHDAQDLCVDVEFNTGCYTHAFIEVLMEKFRTFVSEVTRDPHLMLHSYRIELEEELKLKEDLQIDFNF